MWEAIQEVEAWPRWWRGVESVRELDGGDEARVGSRYRVRWRSFVPYAVEFDFEVERVELPVLMSGRATGDLEGSGMWRLYEQDGVTAVTYEWRVGTTKPWMNLGAPDSPSQFFALNHGLRVMARGGEGLAARLGGELVASDRPTKLARVTVRKLAVCGNRVAIVLKRMMAAVGVAAVAAIGVAYALDGDQRKAEAADRGKPPVVLLVFDEFPTDLLLGPDGRIDAGRYPAFADLARSSSWFPNASTTYDSTPKAIPQIIDGHFPRPGGSPDCRGHPRSLYDVFGRKGYAIAASRRPPRSAHRAVCGRAARAAGDPDPAPGGPPRAAHAVPRLDPPDRRADLWLGTCCCRTGPTCSCRRASRRARAGRTRSGMNSTPGFYSPYLALHAQQRLQLQIRFVDRELGRLIARLRRHGSSIGR